ncbi:hypothetical protein ACFYV7_15020 [Nocardia suismassiliense]|uniref:Uncharacterized protein n=1 Tax=Nocardia suismassiliense TaxID=2077092 RepID=A0ABW6QS86_9NOCA
MLTQRREHHRPLISDIPHFEVVIVEAGFGGIGMAVGLKNAGIDDFTILEFTDCRRSNRRLTCAYL